MKQTIVLTGSKKAIEQALETFTYFEEREDRPVHVDEKLRATLTLEPTGC